VVAAEGEDGKEGDLLKGSPRIAAAALPFRNGIMSPTQDGSPYTDFQAYAAAEK
jgi:hypothetical protein